MDYEHEALLLAERYGIIEYQVKDNMMTYFKTFAMERSIYHCKINLDTKKEVRTLVKTF